MMNGIVLVLLGILATALSAAELKLEADSKSQVFSQYREDYERCKARQEVTPEHGEYDTQEEYRRRVKKLRIGCDIYRRVEPARIEVPVVLMYRVADALLVLERRFESASVEILNRKTGERLASRKS